MRCFFTSLASLTLSCVAAPPGPRGPLRGAGIEWDEARAEDAAELDNGEQTRDGE